MARRKRRRPKPPPAERYGKGTAEWVGRGDRGYWVARVSIPGQKSRARVPLVHEETGLRLTDKEGDRDLARRLAEDVSEYMRAEALEDERRRRAARLTVKQFGEKWTSGKLYEEHGQVRGLKPKASVRSDRVRLKAHVYPHLGQKAVADVTEQDVERCMAKAAKAAEAKHGKPWRQATRFQLYQLLRRLFDLAVKPGRLRADNPVSSDLRPPKDHGEKLFSFLYPDELLALLRCGPSDDEKKPGIPLARRVHYALAVYTGLRKGSLAALTWGSIDLQHGTLTVLKNKTGVPQIFEVDAGLLRLLGDWKQSQGEPASTEPIIRRRDLKTRTDHEAETLREDLRAAGVTREILFSADPNVEPLRFHDMRATFVTWARRAGKSEGWISDRTGHVTRKMMDRYDRGARTLLDLKYEPFPDISKAIPDLSNALSNVTRITDFRRERGK